MFVKYPMAGPKDYRGSVKLIYGELAYSSVEILDDDMVELTDSEVTFVKEKAGDVWLSMRDNLLANIDELSDVVRVSHMEVGMRSIDIEYRQVQNAVYTWESQGSPMDVVPIEIQCWADVNSETVQWAVDDIRAQMTDLENFVSQLRVMRLTAKSEIRNAATADVETVYQQHYDAIAAMENKTPEY